MAYIDTNIFIYAIENHFKFGKACKKILLDIENEKVKAHSSILVLVEIINVLMKINKILKKEGKKTVNIPDSIDAILSLPIIWFDLDFFTIKKAAEYEDKISGAGCVHLSIMEINGINQIISADEELDRVKTLHRIDPLRY